MLNMVKRAGALALVFVMTVSSFVQAAEIGGANDKPVIEVSENEIPENATDSKNDMVSENMAEEDEKTDVLSENDIEKPVEEQVEAEYEEAAGAVMQMSKSEYENKMNSFINDSRWKNGASYYNDDIYNGPFPYISNHKQMILNL